MSGEKPTESNSNDNVTAKDLFGSIPKPIDVDPFEGIDMAALSILRKSADKDELGVRFDEFNRMGGFDIADISRGTIGSVKSKEEDVVSLSGIDTDYISVKRVYPSPDDAHHFDAPLPQSSETADSTSSDDRPVKKKQALTPETPPTPPSEKPTLKLPIFKDLKKVSILYDKANAFFKEIVGKLKTLGEKTGAPSQMDPQDAAKGLSADRLKVGCVYSEVNRVRENIVNMLEKANEKTVVFVSPHDDAGNTFLISLLAFNIAYFTKMKTLLVDLNMRRPQLHLPFGLEQEQGFTDVVSGSLSWQEAVKDTGFSQLKMITAGGWDNKLYLKMTPDFMENMFQEMKGGIRSDPFRFIAGT